MFQESSVTLDANGGYFVNEMDDVLNETLEKTEVLNKIVPVGGTVPTIPLNDQEGITATFLGWSLERDGEILPQEQEGYAPVGDCVLYAVWKYDDAADSSVAIGEDVPEEVLNDPIKTEEPDTSASEGEADQENVSEDTLIDETAAEETADEAPATYAVTLDANGGYFVNEWDDVLGEYVEHAKILNKVIPVEGIVAVVPVNEQDGITATFLGWSLERDGEVVASGEYAPVDSCVLFAVWDTNEVTESEGIQQHDPEVENDVLEADEFARIEQKDGDTSGTTEEALKDRQDNTGKRDFHGNNSEEPNDQTGKATNVKNDGSEIISSETEPETVVSDKLFSSINTPTDGDRYTVLLVDNSGSMADNSRLVIAKQAAIKFCEQMLAADGVNYISIVSYESSVHMAYDFSNDISVLTSEITNMYAMGGTNINAALKQAINSLNNAPEGASKNIVLLSDGLPQSGDTLETGKYTSSDHNDYHYGNAVYETAKSIDSAWNIYTLGFFQGLSGQNLTFGRRLMEDIQNKGYYDVNDADGLSFAFDSISGGIISDNSFMIRRNSNSFEHTSSDFISNDYNNEIGTSYPTSLSYYNKLVKNISFTKEMELLDEMNGDQWGGSCEGLSISIGMSFLNKIDISGFKSITTKKPTCYSELEKPRDNPSLRNLINYYHCLQYVGKNNPKKCIINAGHGYPFFDGKLTLYSSKSQFWEEFINDIKIANQNKRPLLFSFGYDYNGVPEGHSILTCGYNENDQYHIIKLYDCNYINYFIYLYVDKNNHDFYFSRSGDFVQQITDYATTDNWRYFKYSDNWDNYDTEVDELHMLRNIKKSSTAYNTSNTVNISIDARKDFKITNSSGDYIEIKDGIIDSTLELLDFGISGDYEEYYLSLEQDVYTVTCYDNSIKASMRTDDLYYSVDANNIDLLTYNGDDGIALKGENIDYNIRMSSSLSNSLINFKGGSLGDMSIINNNNEIEIISKNKGDLVVTIYGRDGKITQKNIKGYEHNVINIEDLIEIASGKCGDNLYWSLSKSGVLTINGSGDMTDFPYMVAATWYGKDIKELIIEEGVTSIGDYAFCYLPITKVLFPETLESIGDFAFNGCDNLQTVFIPNSVKSIGKGAFSAKSYKSQSKLTSIEIEEENAFYSEKDGIVYNKNGDTLVIYPPGKQGEFVIPNNVSTIGQNAFCGCTGLTSIIIPESVTVINRSAFVDSGITEITIPNSIQVIENNAFSRCVKLKKVIIDAEISVLKGQLFSACNALETLYLPESIMKIEGNVFFDCRSLKDVFFNGSERTWRKVVIEQGQSDDTCIANAIVHFLKENEISILDESCVSIIVDDQIWSGKPLTPSVDVKYENEKIIEGPDYEVSYANNTNVGTATVTITGAGYYTGTVSKTFKINAASITNATVTGVSNKTYTGSALSQNPTVTVGDKTLTKGTDYTVSYANNTNAGTATVTINGKNNYSGTKTATFKINKAAQSITVKAAASSIAVGKTTTASLTGNKGSKSFKSSDTSIATVTSAGKVTAKKVGTVKITATSAATANYNAASKTVTIKVVPAGTASLKADNQATGIKLTWKKVTGANGYKVYRGSTLIKTITSGSTVTYADTKANTNGTKYTYKVVAKSTTGDSTLSKSRVIYRVSRPAVSSVTNSASKKMTVKWGKNAKANGYQIQYSTSKSFASGNKTATITGASTVSKVIGSLTKGKTYYVRIRTYKTVGSTKYWSTWSASKSVKITK